MGWWDGISGEFELGLGRKHLLKPGDGGILCDAAALQGASAGVMGWRGPYAAREVKIYSLSFCRNTWVCPVSGLVNGEPPSCSAQPLP